IATGATPPKTKASVRKTKSSSGTTATLSPTAAGPRLSTSAKGKKLATTSKAKSLSALSKVAMTDAQHLQLATKRSLQQTHISQASGSSADEETGTILGVLDVPTDKSEEEISWNYTNEEETRDEESFDPIPKTPENTDDEGNGEENMGMNVGREEGQDEEDKEDELYKDVNINIGRGIESIFETTSQMDVQTLTLVAPLPVSTPTLTPSTIATITTTQQAPTPPITAPSTLLPDLPNFGSLFGFDHQLKTLEANFSVFMQTNQFARAISSIPEIVQRYMDQQMNEAVKVAIQIQSDRLRDEAQAENDEFLKTIDENMQKIIKEQVKEQVKMELKKILIEKMEGNKSIHRSNEQRNLYKTLVEAYKSDKIILDTYGDTVTLKRRRDDDADKDEEPSAGSDWRSKRRREGKEPESASAPKEKATRSTGKSTQGEEGQKEEDDEEEYLEGRGVQMADVHTTQKFKDSHVTLTLVNPNGQQQSSSVSSQFMTSMLNPTLDAGIDTTSTTPPTTAPSTLLQNLPNFGSLFGFDHQLKILEDNFSEFVQTNQFARAVSSIPGIVQRYMNQRMNEAIKIIKEQVKEQVKVQVYKILPRIEQTVNEQLEAEVLTRNLYKDLVEAYESDKNILDTYGYTVTLKRRRDDDANKDEEPSAGSDQGSKRRREGKEPESASAPKEKATRSTSKSTQWSKSRQMSTSEPETLEEPMQTTHEMEEPSHPEFETGADDQPIAEPSQHPEWFSQQKKPPTPDRDWNKTLSASHRSIQMWISELAKRTDSRSSFNELMDTHVDFLAFLMNRLKVDTLTPKLLAGPTYELMKGSCKNNVDSRTGRLRQACSLGNLSLGRKRQQFYGFAVNRESARDVYSKRRIIAVTELKIVEWHNYKHLDWITLTNLTVEERFAFNVSLRMFTRSILIQRRVEDLQLGVKSYQKKLKLTRPDTYRSDLKRKEAYTAYSNPRGFIYQNKDKQNRLMRIDELQNLSDETLTDVRTALDDRLKGIQMKYLPPTIWRKSDKERAATMIQAIDKHLKTRRIMRSLERYKVVRHRYSNPMIQPESKGSTHGYPLVSVEVLRYDKRSKSENMGVVPTETELILEHTQQGICHEVSVTTYAIRNTKLLCGIEDSHHVPSDAMHNPSQPLKVRKTLF
nr:hypothetical protein [Tanacetum cinerariifolium]